MTSTKPKTLESLSARGRKLLHSSHEPTATHREFKYWDAEVATYLDSKFPGTGRSAEWSSLPTSPLVSGGGYYDSPQHWATFRQAVQKRLAWLGEIGEGVPTIVTQIDNSQRHRIFVVHGRDEAAREKVARFLNKLGLEPIILHERPNLGRTIIEKFTDYSDVAYAVVLLTADDTGGIKGTSLETQSYRARQNVIFELGYFLGKLGRERVCALHESCVEILSDYNGVAYVPFDASEAWKIGLAKELKAVGLPIDLNDLF